MSIFSTVQFASEASEAHFRDGKESLVFILRICTRVPMLYGLLWLITFSNLGEDHETRILTAFNPLKGSPHYG